MARPPAGGRSAVVPDDAADRSLSEPARPRSLTALLATLAPLDEDFPPVDELPLDPVSV